jgi:ATP-dependent protease ClpP protease subunit
VNASINSHGSCGVVSSNHHLILALRKLQKQSSLIGTSQALSAGITLLFLGVLGAGSAIGGFDSRY